MTRPISVLLVESDVPFSQYLAQNISTIDRQIDVDRALTVEEARTEAAKRSFDAVIFNPCVVGVDEAKQLVPGAPLLVVSDDDSVETEAVLKAAGAADFIRKDSMSIEKVVEHVRIRTIAAFVDRVFKPARTEIEKAIAATGKIEDKLRDMEKKQ